MKTKALLPFMLALTAIVLLGCPTPIIPVDLSAIAGVTAPVAGATPVTAIAGVTAPVAGATPVTAITETDQYTGTVTWSGSPTSFAASTVYTATITLTAKTGYTLSGVMANFFTVAGATSVTKSASSGTVTAVFTQTASYVSANIGNLMLVTGGTFNNGTADMTVSSFRMSQYEITMEQFVELTGLTNPSTYFTSVGNGPVQNVNWYHALVFCNKLSAAEGLTPVYSIGGTMNTESWGAIPTTSDDTWNGAGANWNANGYRLPTEAEWQFAARGGNSSNNYTYAGSNTIDGVAWYTPNSSNTTHTVGTKAANELGLYDMCGNVWEWCWDWYGDYPGTAQTDYRGAASGTIRVVRGGSWGSYAPAGTVAVRSDRNPGNQSIFIGFRVVRP
jgi:formylglycine-generating enzyme